MHHTFESHGIAHFETLARDSAYIYNERIRFSWSPREGRRMSEGSMQKFSEKNGRGRADCSLPHCRENFWIRAKVLIQHEPETALPGTQVRGAGEAFGLTPARSVRPSSRDHRVA
jgi:hypothetical protein